MRNDVRCHGQKVRSVMFILLLAMTTWVSSQTTVSGIIDNDVRWIPSKGPYLVNGDILVTRQGRLIIAPGTRIVIAKPIAPDNLIPQIDFTDSTTVSIKVQGVLSGIGRPGNRIVFSPEGGESSRCSWYGMVLDKADSRGTELAFADIVGACHGLTVRSSEPLIRNCVFEFNNVGITCTDNGNARIYNCVITRNTAVGVRVRQANPVLTNNLIVFNKGNGIWSDGLSALSISYNCFYGNRDGNLLDCDPELGVLVGRNARKDSVDHAANLFRDPIFAGSISDSLAVERDVKLPTEKSRIRDTTIAKAFHGALSDSLAARRRYGTYPRYTLSPYSPCIDAGHPGKEFRDSDGSVNDMGIFGGPEIFSGK